MINKTNSTLLYLLDLPVQSISLAVTSIAHFVRRLLSLQDKLSYNVMRSARLLFPLSVQNLLGTQ